MSERKLIPINVELEGLCNNCNGACCRRGTILELSDAERDFLEVGGASIVNAGYKTKAEEEAELRKVLGDTIFDSLSGIVTTALDNPSYLLIEECPYLVETPAGKSVCSVYDDPRKPKVCGNFEPGNAACTQMREERFITKIAESSNVV